MTRIRLSVSAAFVLTVTLNLASVWADDSSSSGAVRIIEPSVDKIEININEGAMIRLPKAAPSVFVANPEIADIAVKSPELIYVIAKHAGETTFFALEGDDTEIANIDIVVTHDFVGVHEALHSVLSGTAVEVNPIPGGLMLTGRVNSALDAEEAKRITSHFVGDDEDIVNRLQVVGPNQVNLRVKVAEVSRNVLERIGFSFDGLLLSGNFQLGLATGRSFVDQSRDSIERLSDTGFAHIVYETSHADINAIIDALESEGLVSLLAEPNLTALSGETASFLAGGEFPVPVVDRLGGASVEFKDYGVSLAFTPTVLTGNRINLKVMPEVSSISSAGATTLNGINIPALTTRRASTSVELGSGQSFAIAGLLLADTDQNVEKFPGLGDLPILGALFRSTRFERRETELVVIVTPYIVRPVSFGTLATPNDSTNKVASGQTHHREAAGDGRTTHGLRNGPAIIPGGFEIK